MDLSTRPWPESDPLVRAARVSLDNLPVLLAMSILLAIAALPGLAIGSSLSWVAAWPVLVLGMAPVWMALVRTSHRLVLGEAVTIRSAVSSLYNGTRLALPLASVPAVLGTALLAMASLAESTVGVMLLCCLLGYGLVVATSQVSLWSLALERNLADRDTWLASFGRTMADPVTAVGTAVLGAVGVAVVATIGPIGVLLAGPLAVWIAEWNTPSPGGPEA